MNLRASYGGGGLGLLFLLPQLTTIKKRQQYIEIYCCLLKRVLIDYGGLVIHHSQ